MFKKILSIDQITTQNNANVFCVTIQPLIKVFSSSLSDIVYVFVCICVCTLLIWKVIFHLELYWLNY